MIEGRVRKIDADDAERFLLSRGILVEEKHVDENIGGCATGLRLESDAEPALAVLVARIASRGNRVGENEEGASIAAPWPEPFEKEPILALEHRRESLAAHVAVARSIHRVAHRGVVCRDGPRHRSRGAADVKEPARHFLACADLREGSVPGGIEVDLERLLLRRGTRHHGLSRRVGCSSEADARASGGRPVKQQIDGSRPMTDHSCCRGSKRAAADLLSRPRAREVARIWDTDAGTIPQPDVSPLPRLAVQAPTATPPSAPHPSPR